MKPLLARKTKSKPATRPELTLEQRSAQAHFKSNSAEMLAISAVSALNAASDFHEGVAEDARAEAARYAEIAVANEEATQRARRTAVDLGQVLPVV